MHLRFELDGRVGPVIALGKGLTLAIVGQKAAQRLVRSSCALFLQGLPLVLLDFGPELVDLRGIGPLAG